jgi:branched-chain amino acid transport system substrate-binding protein
MKKVVYLVMICILVLVTLVGCSTDEQTTEPIKIGVTQDQSGAIAMMGKRIVNSMNLAVEEINAAGGVLGRPIELIILDDRVDPELTTSNAIRLIESDEVVAITGGSGSSCAIALAKVALDYQTPYLITIATSHQTLDPFNPYVFRVPDCEYDEAASFMLKAKQLGAETIAVLYADVAWGQGVSEYIEQEASNFGLTVVGMQGHSMQADNLMPQVLKLKEENPDCIIYVEYDPGCIMFATALKELGWMPKCRVVGTGPSLTSVVKAHPEIMDGFCGTGILDVWKPSVQAWLDKYEAKYGERTSYDGVAYAYDCIHLLVEAIEIAQSTDREAIRDALEQIRDYKCMAGKEGASISYSPTDHEGLSGEDTQAFEVQGGLIYLDSKPTEGCSP